ncbi:MAG: AtpZ/AtpI family protein [Gemmatimonadetes bacterium]|nr:AtpZ/AtpI family protein [Gemmatimonadota bacterium]MBI3567667.1 AtpZ/AtpI family protein [Gemmatimonadota bacterium]
MTGSETPPSDDPTGQAEREVARRRDELLAQARGEGPKPGDGGQRLMGLGIQFVVAILLFLYLGMWLDRKLGTAPWFMLVGMLVGAGGGFYSLYRAMVSENKRLDDEERRGK